MEPITISAITAALTALATEVAKGGAGEAGKAAWNRMRGLLGGKTHDAIEQAQAAVTERLDSNPAIIRELLTLLKSSQSVNAKQLVGSIDADKVVVAENVNTLHM